LDTITHIALGACIGELVAGKRIGKKALIAGAVAQNIPDIDVISALWMDPSSSVLAHRGLTHSFLFAIVFSVVSAWLINRRWGERSGFRFWFRFLSLQLFVHIILDTFNAYGTGWFEPFSDHRFSFHGLFVMDPFFLLPIGVAAILLIIWKPTQTKRGYLASVAILISTTYLAYAMVNKSVVDTRVKTALQASHIETNKYFITPTPFNAWLWFFAASGDKGSFVGYRSIFDSDDIPVEFRFFSRNDSLLVLADRPDHVNHLVRFSQGFYTVEKRSDTISFNDLRFGQMGGWKDPLAEFVFHYYLHPDLGNKLVMQRGRVTGWEEGTFPALVNRIRGIR